MIPFTAALERRLNRRSGAPLAVALSGGSDSLALLHLTLDWARANARPVLALTVDHGLSPDSPAWSAAAGAKAQALGADWRALAWEGPKPATGVPARARTARHALLAGAARAAGASVLLMGHTADDIAEGEAMRRADAPGLGRLREWSPSPAWPEGRGIFLLRPLLRVRRADLRAMLEARGAGWLDDPANADPRFARARARQALSGAATAIPFGADAFGADAFGVDAFGVDAFGVDAFGVDAFEVGLDAAIPALARRLSFTAEGVVVDRSSLAAAPASAAKPVLAAALLSLSGSTRPPRGPALERLFGVIAAGGAATLGGCRIDAEGDTVRVAREPARRGLADRPAEPLDWIRTRFEAACGLFSDEASLPPL